MNPKHHNDSEPGFRLERDQTAIAFPISPSVPYLRGLVMTPVEKHWPYASPSEIHDQKLQLQFLVSQVERHLLDETIPPVE